MPRRLPPLLTLGLMALSCGSARAANGTAPESPYFEELPVVLSVSRLPQSLADTPGALTVIDRDTIRATGYRRLPDLLRLVPGFNVAWFRGWHGVAGYHGFAGDFPNRVLVLIDGRPANSESFTGSVDWLGQALDLDDIDRIEVLRGSNSTAYGTNAFLGVINIRTRPASQARGVYVQATEGDYGISDQTLRLGGGIGPLDLRLTLNQSADNGLDELRDDSRHRFANLRASLRLGAQDELSLDLGEVSGRGTEGFGLKLDEVSVDPATLGRQALEDLVDSVSNPVRDRRIRNSSQQLRWRHVVSPEHEFSLQYFRNRDRYIDEIEVPPRLVRLKLALGLRPDAPIDQNREAVKEGLEFQHFLRVSPQLRAVWGLEWRRDRAVSDAFFSRPDPIGSHTRRLFGNLEWSPVDPLTLNIGAMAEQVSTTGTAVSPRLFANWEGLPGHVLRAGVSTATRSPTLFELFGQPRTTSTVGNPDLERERITAYEAGYFGQLPALGLQADLRLSEERLSKLITSQSLRRGDPLSARPGNPFLPYGSRYANADTARIRGASYRIKWSPYPATQFVLNQAFTYVSQRDPSLERSAPTHSTSLMWTQALPGSLSFSLMHYSVGAISWQGSGDYIPAYRRTDARLGYAFRSGGLRGEISLVGLNLFDDYYEYRIGEPPQTHIFGSRYYGTVRLEF